MRVDFSTTRYIAKEQTDRNSDSVQSSFDSRTHKRMQDTILLPHINSTRSKFTTNIYLFRRASSLVIDRVLAFVFERRSKKDKRMASKKGRYGKARPKSSSLVRSVLTRVARLLHAICDQSLSTLFLHRRIEIDRYSALQKGTEFV